MKKQVITSHIDPLGLPPVGRWLKAQRDLLGYSLSQASEMTHMSEGTLQLLEAERFLELPVPAFARSYLRRYAPCLKLDVQEVMALFDAWMLIQQAQDHRLNNHNISRQAADKLQPGPFTAGTIFMFRKLGKRTRQANDAFDSFIHSKTGHAAAIALSIGVFSFFLSNTSTTYPESLATVKADVVVATLINSNNALIGRETPAVSNEIVLQKAQPRVANSSYLMATATTHVTVFDKNQLILFRGIVKPGRPVAISGLKPFDIESARVGTITLVDADLLPAKNRRIAAL